jgi:hypothetical protein
MKPLSSIPPTAWKQRYETLRQHSLAGQHMLAATPLGLILVYRQGVAGWMRQWREEALPGPSAGPLPLPSLWPATRPDWQQQLTHLLAQITMTQLLA